MNTSKDMLARLLATENISVVHKQAKTASFNVRDRILTLPLWDDMKSDTYDHLVGHEVGHALYTPEAGWHESTHQRGETFRSFLNVVEDARIERLIQKRYQGLRVSFISSYKRMLADGFFGGDINKINKYGLIDRINTHFKCGRSAGVRIEADEQVWVDEIETLETWDEVVDLTERLYEFCKKKQEEENQQNQSAANESMSGEDDEDDGDFWSEDEDGGYDFDEDEDEDEKSEGESDGSDGDDYSSDEPEENEDEDGESTLGGGAGGESPEDDEMSSKTDESLRKSIASEHGDSDDIEITNVFLNDSPVDDLIISSKDVLSFLQTNSPYGNAETVTRNYERIMSNGDELSKQFMVNNKQSVNYMAKEFEMKKSASAYSRQTMAKTGVIDPVKMNSYRYNDDIFRKITVTPDGKSHGIIMYVDWSGSMIDDIKATIDQMLNLVLFCRKVKIPYRVYAFTNSWNDFESEHATQEQVDYQLRYDSSFRLLEFFNNNMDRKTFNDMVKFVLAVGAYYDIRSTNGRRKYDWVQCRKYDINLPRCLALGGTPLDNAIMAGIKVHAEFQKKNRLDIVNTIFLTDGDSHPMAFPNPDAGYNTWTRGCFNSKDKVMYINDSVTKKRYRVTGYSEETTAALLKIYRERTGSNTIGYRIIPTSVRQWCRESPNGMGWYDAKDFHEKTRKEKFVVLKNDYGYDELFFIMGGKHLEVSNNALEVESDASKAKIRSAFKKANGSRKGSRKMLSDLIESIA